MNDILKREFDLLNQERVTGKFSIDTKKDAFAEDLKAGLGKIIKEKISNTDRHKPKKLSFWGRFKKALGC
jgi:hypothetical protein